MATARNDDHGANLLGRIQTFLNALFDQAREWALPVELVLVEWNPPADRPPLAQALRWPADPAPCCRRIITVPHDLHSRYRYAEALPLYQMIAKNAGIRRAKGEFILATNIDILFSHELMRFLAERRLDPARMYRIDRTDVDAGVPVDTSVAGRLAYCEGHRIRLHAQEGSFSLTDGYRSPAAVDIATIGSGISFGRGWHAPEQHFGQVFRRASKIAEMALRPGAAPRTLLLEVEPGPQEIRLKVLAPATAAVPLRAGQRTLVRIPVPGGTNEVRLSAAGARVLRCQWDTANPSSVTAEKAPARVAARTWQTLTAAARFLVEKPPVKGPRRIGLPFSAPRLGRLGFRAGSTGLSLEFLKGTSTVEAGDPPDLHTNACGDFTLAHRRRWMELRGYPEFDLYSMNLDALFCYMAHYAGAAEEVLGDPLRIYHIEHAAGSGWTPESQRLLFGRLAAKGVPWLEFDEVLNWARQMERLRTPMIFNREDWGLGNYELPET